MYYKFKKTFKLDLVLIQKVNSLISEDIAKIINMLPIEELAELDTKVVKGGAFDQIFDGTTPFGYGREIGFDKGSSEKKWVVEKFKDEYMTKFNQLQVDGKIPAAVAKQEMKKSKLPFTELGKIWKLSDIDQDGLLDEDEFAVAMYLIKTKLEGFTIPDTLPTHIIPPSKIKMF